MRGNDWEDQATTVAVRREHQGLWAVRAAVTEHHSQISEEWD